MKNAAFSILIIMSLLATHSLAKEPVSLGYTPAKVTTLVAYPERVLPGGSVTLVAKLTKGNKPVKDVPVRFFMDDQEIQSHLPGPVPKTDQNGLASRAATITAELGATVRFVAKPDNGFPQSNVATVVVVSGAWEEDTNHAYQGFDILDDGLWDVGEYPWTVVGKDKTTQAAMLCLKEIPSQDVSIVSAAPGTAKITPANTRQKDTNTPVEGVAAGETHAEAGNPEISRLKLLVKEAIEYTIKFYYAEDDAQPSHKTSRTPEREEAIIDTLGEVWTKQSNIHFKKGSSEKLLLNGDWGNSLSADRINQIYDMVAPGRKEIAIVFVWQSAFAGGGATQGNKCIIKDSANGVVVAHEVGHAMGLIKVDIDCDYPESDQHSRDVMCKTATYPRVRKFQTQTLHANYPSPQE